MARQLLLNNTIEQFSYSMNSSELSSSESASQDRLDFERFQGIWNNIKKAKQSSVNSHTQKQSSNQRKSIASVKKAIEEQEQINIETRLILTEKQLQKSKQNTNLLLKKLSQAEEQIQYLEYELDKESRQKQEVLQQFQSLKQSYAKKDKQKRSELQKSTLREHHSESQLQKLKQSLSQKQRQIDKLNLKLKSLQMNNKSLQSEIGLLKQNTRILEKRCEQNQKTFLLNQSNLVNNNRGSQILQLQEAYNIIERLSILLKNTEEYKTFALPLQDIKNYHFLRNIQQRLKRNQLSISQKPGSFTSNSNNTKLCQCVQIKVDQKFLWSPALCYKKVLEIKLKYNSNLTEQCIEELLFEINQIYVSKQESYLRKLQQMYDKKLENIKRKSQPKYDQLVARKQIQRLKKQVLTQRYSKSRSGKTSQLSDNLQILKTIGQYEDELKLKEKQIQLLKQRIRLMENQNTNYDKILYLEGSLWVLDKVIMEIQLNSEDLHDFETKFREKIQQDMVHEEWTNSFKYFFENITQNQNNLMEKILMMKESTLKKMGSRKDYQKSSATTPQQQHEASFGGY